MHAEQAKRFPEAGSLAVMELASQAVAVTILDEHRDGTRMVCVIGRDGVAAQHIVPLEELGDPTPLDDAERAMLNQLAVRANAREFMTREEKARLLALRERVAIERILKRLIGKAAA